MEKINIEVVEELIDRLMEKKEKFRVVIEKKERRGSVEGIEIRIKSGDKIWIEDLRIKKNLDGLIESKKIGKIKIIKDIGDLLRRKIREKKKERI